MKFNVKIIKPDRAYIQKQHKHVLTDRMHRLVCQYVCAWAWICVYVLVRVCACVCAFIWSYINELFLVQKCVWYLVTSFKSCIDSSGWYWISPYCNFYITTIYINVTFCTCNILSSAAISWMILMNIQFCQLTYVN